MAARRRAKGDGIPAIEWVTGVVGLAIVLGTLGFIAYEAFSGGGEEAALEIRVEGTATGPAGFTAAVLVRNRSRKAAAEVLLEGVIRSRAGGETRARARLDYVPGLSTRRATLVFPAPPEAGAVDVRIVGYTTP